MLERKHDCAETSHGYAGDGSVCAITGSRKPLLNVVDQVTHNVIFVAVLRSVC